MKTREDIKNKHLFKEHAFKLLRSYCINVLLQLINNIVFYAIHSCNQHTPEQI